jgi:hypothetical protein
MVKFPTFEDVVEVRQLDEVERIDDFTKLKVWSGNENGVKRCGNKYLQHYQTRNLAKTSYEGRPSLYEVFQTQSLLENLYKLTFTKDEDKLATNMPQAYSRRNPVCYFKPSTAKYLYKQFKARKVLDMTAGWGGRMIGAYACDIDYIGIDTNVELKPVYETMMTELSPHSKGTAQMIWDSWKNVDFSKIEFDLMLTSPPYYNKEIYEHMNPFGSKDEYYKDFLIPMIETALKYIQTGGWVCININPEFYEELIGGYGFKPADKIEQFQQSTCKTKDGGVKYENVYCWSSVPSTCSGCSDCKKKDEEIRKLKEMLKMLL